MCPKRRSALAVTPHATQPPPNSSASSIWLRGDEGAPEQARRHVLSHLGGDVPRVRVSDAVLIVSELVTNSVLHASGGFQQAIFLELTTVGDNLRIAVLDEGSNREPHLMPADPATPGGFGLRLVDQLASAWGVVHDVAGTTRVWCDVPLGS